MESQTSFSSQLAINSEPSERNRLEINRRLGILNYRRDRLVRELHAINAALFTLNQQKHRDTSCKQLSI